MPFYMNQFLNDVCPPGTFACILIFLKISLENEEKYANKSVIFLTIEVT